MFALALIISFTLGCIITGSFMIIPTRKYYKLMGLNNRCEFIQNMYVNNKLVSVDRCDLPAFHLGPHRIKINSGYSNSNEVCWIKNDNSVYSLLNDNSRQPIALLENNAPSQSKSLNSFFEIIEKKIQKKNRNLK